jgi:hypothetical protein
VSGCAIGEERPLFAGESLRASCKARDFRIDRARPSEAATATAASVPHAAPELPPSAAPPASIESSGGALTPPIAGLQPRPAPVDGSWQSLARASRFKDALARVNERGFDAELARASPEDLALLGDVARFNGDSGRALRAYERARARSPGSEVAANAAFSIGRIDFDERRAYADAARWFGVYVGERPQGRLAREALGRQMEALSRAGDAAGAQRIAEQYLARYPEGPHAAFARTLRASPP